MCVSVSECECESARARNCVRLSKCVRVCASEREQAGGKEKAKERCMCIFYNAANFPSHCDCMGLPDAVHK